MMKRILVIGSPGSGKTTLALRLGARLGIPVVHLDRLNWMENWQMRETDTFLALLERELRRESWIIDGHYMGSLAMRLACCDTVIWLDYPRLVCLWNVVKRMLTSYGRTRPDMGDDCPERFDWSFLRYVWRFNGKYRAETRRLLREERDKTVVVLKSRRACRRFAKTLPEADAGNAAGFSSREE